MLRDLPVGAERVLDYGCGSGAYLRLIAGGRPGLKLFGTDRFPPPPLPPGVEWLALEQVEAAGPFDWITLAHVVEHVAEPLALLERLARVLAPDGGGIWIATPNADSFIMDAAGSWARDIDFPRHREVFTARGLTRILARSGLDVTPVAPPIINAALNTWSTLRNVLADRSAGVVSRAWAFCKTSLALAGHALQPTPRRMATSPELIMICRRRT